jgi:hypothetical protein
LQDREDEEMMNKNLSMVWMVIALTPTGAMAQTVTGSGTSGEIPVFSGASVITNSVITQSSSNIGIGTTTPGAALTIGNHTYTGALGSSSNGQYQILLYDDSLPAYSYGIGVESYNIGFNSAGGYKFYHVAGSTPMLVVGAQNSTNVGIGTASPGALLEVNGNVKLTSGSGASITFADGTVQSTAYTG